LRDIVITTTTVEFASLIRFSKFIMTLETFGNESLLDSVDVPPLELCSSKAGSRRFNLRKRSLSSDEEKMNLSSYNSAFLSGLFADVANASQSQEDEEADPATATTASSSESFETEEEARLDPSISMKRSRVSLTRSFSRCGRSYKNLALAEIASPVAVDRFPKSSQAPSSIPPTTLEPNCSSSMERINSLHYQLNCVSDVPSSGASPKSVKSVVDIIDMAFPHLPATVSDSSCSKQQQQNLTQKLSDHAVSDSETSSTFSSDNTTKESYGWFVDLDEGDEDEHDETDPYSASRSPTSDLAFSAPTAPKRKSNYEAEVEFALAADTVDDVLGDFF
jgi:hypothetical protein